MTAATTQPGQSAEKPVPAWAQIAGHFGVPICEAFSWKADNCPGLPFGSADLRELASTIGGVGAFFDVSKSTASAWKHRGATGFNTGPAGGHDLRSILKWRTEVLKIELPNQSLVEVAFVVSDLEDGILFWRAISEAQRCMWQSATEKAIAGIDACVKQLPAKTAAKLKRIKVELTEAAGTIAEQLAQVESKLDKISTDPN